MIDNELFLKVVPNRFPGDKYMENNVANQHLKTQPFLFEEKIFSLAGNEIITAKQLQDYMDVKEACSRFLESTSKTIW